MVTLAILMCAVCGAASFQKRKGNFCRPSPFRGGLASYERALELNPRFEMAWLNKGVSLAILGRHEEALASSERALELNPRDAKAWLIKSLALDALGRCEEALPSYERALELNPGDKMACRRILSARADKSPLSREGGKAVVIEIRDAEAFFKEVNERPQTNGLGQTERRRDKEGYERKQRGGLLGRLLASGSN